MGFLWTVLDKILRELLGKFLLLISVVLSTCFRANIFKSKGEFIKSFQKRFLEFFTTNSILVFLTHLSYPLLYQSYRDFYCERILGDQSVVITKV